MRSNIMYIINVLRLFSCKEKPLTHSQITDYLNKYYDPVENNFINNSTTKRLLTDYIGTSIHLNDMPNTKLHANFKIHVVEKNPYATAYSDEYIDITDRVVLDEEGKGKSKTRYYYYEPFVSPEDLSDLINMIECHPYYNTEEVISITQSLKNISPGYFSQSSYLPTTSNRAIDTTLRENLHQLYHLISKKVDIKIVYCRYNEDMQLVPMRGYETPHRITPYRIMWANGYCYLVAYNSYYNKESNYRVDRITEIHTINDDSAKDQIGKHQKLPSSIDYAKSHPVMISGDTTRVSMLCKKSSSIVNRLIDSFGKNILIRPAEKKKLDAYFPGKSIDYSQWLDVTCSDTNEYGVALWAKQYCTECVLYYPPALAEQTKNELKEAAAMYL